mmetsp:Transcript_90683/g.292711  ORF Transcript_90683/g.292711 Transcript_90683/m.292711 type:complete len:100 (+) Transcript_90683:147-446(+)
MASPATRPRAGNTNDPEYSNAAKSPASGGSVRSALRGGELRLTQGDSECRTDWKGQTIAKGGSHHLSFVDEHKPGKNLMEVKEVQAYKNSRPGCGCTVT